MTVGMDQIGPLLAPAADLPEPLPEPHTHPDGRRWPPDGDAQPQSPEEQAGIGLAYPRGGDFGPYVQRLGECPHLWNSLNGVFNRGLDWIEPPFDGPFSAGNVHPHTGLLLFSLAVNARPAVIVETGTFYGYSTWFLAQALDWWGEGTIWSLDVDHSKVAPCVRDHPRVKLVTGHSLEVLPKLAAEAGRIDLAFLDSYKRIALAEFRIVADAMPEGGLVAFHDTQLLNTGLMLWLQLRDLEGWDKMLFCGTGSGHRFTGNADDRGLFLLRRRESRPFLGVADHGTHSENMGATIVDGRKKT